METFWTTWNLTVTKKEINCYSFWVFINIGSWIYIISNSIWFTMCKNYSKECPLWRTIQSIHIAALVENNLWWYCLFLCIISLFTYLVILSSPEDMLIDFRDRVREGGREGNIHVRDKHQLVVSCMYPNQGSNLQPGHVSRLGIEHATFWFTRHCSNQLSHTSQSCVLFIAMKTIVMQNVCCIISPYPLSKSSFIPVLTS